MTGLQAGHTRKHGAVPPHPHMPPLHTQGPLSLQCYKLYQLVHKSYGNVFVIKSLCKQLNFVSCPFQRIVLGSFIKLSVFDIIGRMCETSHSWYC